MSLILLKYIDTTIVVMKGILTNGMEFLGYNSVHEEVDQARDSK